MATRPLSELAAYLNQLADSAGAGVSDAELLHRFAESRDEAAFELLVWRHGGLVLGVCRRTLGRSADADDAFQAAFLALARKAGSVRRGESLPGWLHRVALRAALRLRTIANRRARVESHHLPEDAVACPALLPDDTAAILDEEIGQLPDKLRVAFVLCHMLGRTHEEAAEQLGCPRGTVLSRVARARERLQARLTRRGWVAPAVAGIVCVEQTMLPAALVAGTVGASVGFATCARTYSLPIGSRHWLTRAPRGTASNWLKPAAAALVVVALRRGRGAGRARSARRPDRPEPPPVYRVAGSPRRSAPRAGAAPNFKLSDRGLGAVAGGSGPVLPGRQVGSHRGRESERRHGRIRSVAVWDAATGKHVHTLIEPEDFGAAMAFSPDSKLFATANVRGNIV